MTEPARADTHLDDIEAARVALAERVGRGDLSALAEYFELGGIKVRAIEWVEPPR